MLPDRVSNQGPLTYESDAPPIALRGPGLTSQECMTNNIRDITCLGETHCKNQNFHDIQLKQVEAI